MLVYHFNSANYRLCYYVMLYRFVEQLLVMAVPFVVLPWLQYAMNLHGMSEYSKVFIPVYHAQNFVVEVYVLSVIWQA